jgi:hypothetical protein
MRCSCGALRIDVKRGQMAKKKNPAAVALGRRGGKATAEKLTAEERKASARKAVLARWAKKKPS